MKVKKKKIVVYLAGPLFSHAERLWNKMMAVEIETARDGLFKVQLPQETTPVEKGVDAIYKHCKTSVEKCDIILANLDGPDADSGTAWEVGYAMGLGKPSIAYRTDFRKCEGENNVNIMLFKGHDAYLDCTDMESVHGVPGHVVIAERLREALFCVAHKRKLIRKDKRSGEWVIL